MINIEQLKADRQAGTAGPWHKYKCQCGHPSCDQHIITPQGGVGFYGADADRIARLPDLEDALIDAIETLQIIAQYSRGGVVTSGEISGDRDEMIGMAREFLARHNKGKWHG